MVPRILIIAGSDSGGGAGIQADIKTVTMFGGHAMTAITAITAQNTLGVEAVLAIEADLVLRQVDAVVADLGVDAVKIGMIGSPDTADRVAERMERLDGVPIVFDPVMVATSGSLLADDATVAAFERLMRIATLTTPNVPELERLAGQSGEAGARLLAEKFGCAVLAKGGDLPGDEVVDWLVTEDGEVHCWTGERIDTRHSHGTGCTFASAIATELARGAGLKMAIGRARSFVRAAMLAAPGFGAGHGPMGHSLGRVPFDDIHRKET